MDEKKYLIWLDLLGFEELANEIGSQKGLGPELVREQFLNVIEERVEAIEAKSLIVGKHRGRDDWVLVADDLDKVFESILGVLDHNTMYEGYERVPLEIAVGTGEFDKWASLEEEKLIVNKATIQFLKSNIVHYYHKWYEAHHSGQRVKSTFTILTESAYQQLDTLDRKMCRRTGYEYHGKPLAFFIADVETIQRRGKMFEFLRRIGHQGSRWYHRIDFVYTPPSEYQEIKKTLEEKRIVFITGTQQYGKTYTAVRLMWEYFCRGYAPKWIEGGEESDRIRARAKLENIGEELESGHIIYFEDPFGKTRYEHRETLERDIGVLLTVAQQADNTYVVITSREEVFKEFEKEKLSEKELRWFENKLNLKKPSYDYEKRKEMIVQWAEAQNCRWLREDALRTLVLTAIEKEGALPTPLSIRNFAVETVSLETENGLTQQILDKSKETEKAFAREIKNMSDDKILFLSFLFISDSFYDSFVEPVYRELVEELKLRQAWDFTHVLEWFKDDKVKTTDYGRLEFSHPSYSQAIRYLLVENGYATEINKRIFGKLLLKLSKKNEAARAVADTLAENWASFPEEVRNELLLKLSERDEVIASVVLAVIGNFPEYPKQAADWLVELSKKNEAAPAVAGALSENWSIFPEDVRNELLLKLSERDIAILDVASIVSQRFDSLRADIRNKLLLRLLKEDRIPKSTVWIAVGNVCELPEEVGYLLNCLAQQQEETVGYPSRGLPRKKQSDFSSVAPGISSIKKSLIGRNVLLSVADKDKQDLIRLAKRIEKLGFNIYATLGTSRFLKERNIGNARIKKIHEGRPNVIDAIKNRKVGLLVNTREEPGSKYNGRDERGVLQLAAQYGIPCIISIEAVRRALGHLLP